MSDAYNYDALKATAAGLINRFGTDATIRKPVNSGAGYEPVVTWEEYVVRVVRINPTRMQGSADTAGTTGQGGELTQSEGVRFILQAPKGAGSGWFNYFFGDIKNTAVRILCGGVEYSVTSARRLEPGPTALLTFIEARI
jgi:hypothetical protein